MQEKDFHLVVEKLCPSISVVLFIDDIHHGPDHMGTRTQVIQSSKINFFTYGYVLDKSLYPKIPNNYFLPHSAQWIIGFNPNPINKILISGRVSDIYPDRKYLINLAKKTKSKFDVLKCNVPYRGVISESDIFGKNYYEYLNKYICCFVDTPRDYIVAKNFEICAGGSLLLCANSQLIDVYDKLGFVDGFNYISCSMSNICEKIDWILNPANLNQVNKIRLSGQELIKKLHTSSKRYDKVLEILNDFDK